MPIWDANNLSAPHTQRELTQIAEASASVFSRSNEQIDTLRAELAAEKEKVARVLALRNELSWSKKTRSFADMITNAIAAYEVKP